MTKSENSKINPATLAAEIRTNIKNAQKSGKLANLTIKISTKVTKDSATISVQIIDGPNPKTDPTKAALAIREIQDYMTPLAAWQNGWNRYAHLSIVNH
jgi:hypothetical protein